MTPYYDAAAAVRKALPGRDAKIALVLGSGLGSIADAVEDAASVSFADIPGFPKPSVDGHHGKLVHGTLSGRQVFVLQGRAHAYEGHDLADVVLPVRTMEALGVTTLVLTNAAGSLREEMAPGSLMMLTDHINWSGANPLIGPNDASLGPRFFDMTRAYDRELHEVLRRSAEAEGVILHEGVYLWALGPNFETPAEIRAFRMLGADAVGMSTVPEVLAARHAGLKVAAISGITNFGAGMVANEILDHEHTLAQGETIAESMTKLLLHFLKDPFHE
ncbi:purine-nucleoside phosphorylase [Nisaea acidiphila]|uniref:Purine nucleoside phosphorylase n=1 Tax=Nisaea acidiphila TaxID=1862145 RepID=A0A9J7AMU4_9PROT|nr:purine-nucleoside phosphorylase [Nisaea acidiphila]UUX48274.1 purine-nucleoside phosphorylase [Nisaea acidiphila]